MRRLNHRWTPGFAKLRRGERINTDLFWWGERLSRRSRAKADPREPKVFYSVAARRQTTADRIQNGGDLRRSGFRKKAAI
jgi:hypothetical protein